MPHQPRASRHLTADESTTYNQIIFLSILNSFMTMIDVRQEMLFIKILSETTPGEDIFNALFQ